MSYRGSHPPPRKRGVLYVLVEQMARSHEIPLTQAI